MIILNLKKKLLEMIFLEKKRKTMAIFMNIKTPYLEGFF